MSIFGSSKTDKVKDYALIRSTYDIYLGIPEAEAEANDRNINLSAVFEDYLDIFRQINEGKFILSSESAVGKYNL